jgi:transposase
VNHLTVDNVLGLRKPHLFIFVLCPRFCCDDGADDATTNRPVTMVQSAADKRAAERSKAGLTRELQVLRSEYAPHPSHGGARGYPAFYREEVLTAVEQGGMAAVDAFTVSCATVYRWLQRPEHYRMTGGNERNNLVEQDQLLLSMVLFMYPNARADQIGAFIYNNGGALYSREDISKRMKQLGLSKKKGSTEAYQAFTPRNLLRCQRFSSEPTPLGVVGVQQCRFIDIDEFGISLDQTNTSHGHAHTSIRIRKPGHYTRSQKVTVILGIEPGDPTLPPDVDGSVGNPRRWCWIRDVSGTNAIDFAAFCDRICTNLEQHPAP